MSTTSTHDGAAAAHPTLPSTEAPLMLPSPGPDGRPVAPAADAPPKNGNEHGGEHGGEHAMQIDIPPIGTGRVIAIVIGFAVLFAILFLLGLWPSLRDRHAADREAKAASDAKPIVNVASPKAPSVSPTLQVPGTAQAYAVTQLYPRTSGFLKKLYVDIGDRVTQGQLLADIETPEVDAQLAASQATLQQANAARQRAQDDYDLAQTTLERYEGFAKTGGVTQQQLDERRSAFTTAKSTLAGAQANVRADQAEVDRLTALVGFAKVYAPFNGTINTRGYDLGALLTAGGSAGSNLPLFTISQTDTLRAFVDLPQAYAPTVKVDQRVEFAVPNYPGKPFEGYIARTSGSINTQTRTLRVEADFPNRDGRLFPGMYGTLIYKPEQPLQRLMIPSAALIYGPQGTRVAVVDDKNVAHFKTIEIGADLGTELEVTHGLAASDRVVTNPGERLTDNIEVDVAKPDEQQGGKGTAVASSGNGNGGNSGSAGGNNGAPPPGGTDAKSTAAAAGANNAAETSGGGVGTPTGTAGSASATSQPSPREAAAQ